jgi:hypothetical protein
MSAVRLTYDWYSIARQSWRCSGCDMFLHDCFSSYPFSFVSHDQQIFTVYDGFGDTITFPGLVTFYGFGKVPS